MMLSKAVVGNLGKELKNLRTPLFAILRFVRDGFLRSLCFTSLPGPDEGSWIFLVPGRSLGSRKIKPDRQGRRPLPEREVTIKHGANMHFEIERRRYPASR